MATDRKQRRRAEKVTDRYAMAVDIDVRAAQRGISQLQRQVELLEANVDRVLIKLQQAGQIPRRANMRRSG